MGSGVSLSADCIASGSIDKNDAAENRRFFMKKSLEIRSMRVGISIGGLCSLCVMASLTPAAADDSDRRLVPDYLAVMDHYVDPATARDATHGVGGSLIAGFLLDQQIAVEVKAFGAGLDRHRPGSPFVIGMGGDVKATGRHGFFVTGGGGVEYGSVDDSHRASPYVEVGGGWEYRVLTDLSLRVEADYRLLSNAGNRGGFGSELWAGAGVVVDLPGRRYESVPASAAPLVQVVPVRCSRPPDGLSVDGRGDLVAQDSRTIAVDFATDSATLDASAQTLVAELAAALRCGNGQQLAIQVVGHADVRGDAVYNVKLSRRRANAVRDALIANGVDNDRISIDGVGKYEPLQKGNDTTVNRANRKIEIKLYPGVVPG